MLVSLAVAPAPFQAVEVPSARLLRVSLLEGDVTYQRTDLDRWVDLSINTPIVEGDKVWVGRGGRAEVEFENGGFARLSENTIMEFSRLADINSRDGVEVRLIQGLASFEARPEPAFTIQTPLFSAQLNDAASFRVDVETDGSGRLVVFNGKLEVSGPASRLFVRKGEVVRFLSQDADRYYLETNYVKDEWDRWDEERQDYLTKITQERFHYGDRGWTTADLYNYGSWYDVPTYGRVWRPASVDADWVPFRSGRWCWYSSFGWTWISYEPWGWIPYHYGRWANVNGYGWSWVPGPRYVSWCPGAVNWVQGTQWVGWVPLAPHEPWYGYGHGGVNVFVSKNFRHRGSATYLPHDSFVNGTPPRGFRSPRDPYADGRIIAGQPRINPTPASRMPVAGNPTPRVFTNEDLEARRNMRERIVNVGRNSGSQNPPSEMERMRQERSRLDTGAASGFTNGGTRRNRSRHPDDSQRLHTRTNSTSTVVRQLESTKAAPHDPNNASEFIGWILRDLAPPNRLCSDSHPPRGRVPRRPCPIHLSILQPVLPRTQTIDLLLASACMKCIAGERTQAEPIVTRLSRFSGRLPQLDTIPYTPPSPPPAMSHPAGPPCLVQWPSRKACGTTTELPGTLFFTRIGFKISIGKLEFRSQQSGESRSSERKDGEIVETKPPAVTSKSMTDWLLTILLAI